MASPEPKALQQHVAQCMPWLSWRPAALIAAKAGRGSVQQQQRCASLPSAPTVRVSCLLFQTAEAALTMHTSDAGSHLCQALCCRFPRRALLGHSFQHLLASLLVPGWLACMTMQFVSLLLLLLLLLLLRRGPIVGTVMPEAGRCSLHLSLGLPDTLDAILFNQCKCGCNTSN